MYSTGKRSPCRFAAFSVLLCLICSSLAGAQQSAPVRPVESQQYASADEMAAIKAQLAEQSATIARLGTLEQQRARTKTPVRVSGYVQMDWIVHNQASRDEINYSTETPLNQDRFTLRRGHLRVDAERGLLSGALEIDVNTTNGPQVRPIDAEVSLHSTEDNNPNQLRVTATAGLIKIPFGFEVPELDVERPFLERSSLMRALFPGEFDLGARIVGQYRFAELAVAVMNGHPLGDNVFPAVAPNRTKEFVGRLGTHTEIAPSVILDLGVSADTGNGFHEGAPTSKDQLVWRDDNGDGIVQATEIQVIPGSSATPSQQFHRFALGGDARVAIRIAPHAELSLRAEVVRASNLGRGIEPADPVGAGRDLREFGWYLGATQEITAFSLVGVRYDRYNPDQDASEQRAMQVVPRDRSYSTLALLAMLRYDNARLAIEYDVNQNALGRDVNGAPTNLKSDALTVRAQVRF
jgi:hypothetical protein